MRIVRRFDFLCRLKHEQCEPGCNYFVNSLLKKITSTTTISSQVVRPPTSKGAFRYDDFEYSRYGCPARRVVLSPRELIYQQSKGLTVVEWNKLITSTDDYLDRYNAIFAALKNQSKLSLEGKSEDEAFEILGHVRNKSEYIDTIIKINPSKTESL